jgi:hypothetical protein
MPCRAIQNSAIFGYDSVKGLEVRKDLYEITE